MAIHSFLKAERGDPDWQFSPEDYFGKEFKIIDASIVELDEGEADQVVLRQNPTERELLAKHLKIVVRSGAILDINILNEMDPSLQQVFLYDIHLRAGSALNLGIYAKNGKLNKHIIQVHQEESSIFSTYGMMYNDCGGDTEVITKIVHQGPNTLSNQLYLGLAGEDSQTVFQSIVIAELEATGSNIGIESANLILEPSGRCYSKPETFINADFVSSGYSSETGNISLEKISYLEGKGIKEEDAQKMIISAFRNQAIDLIPAENIRDELREMYAS